MLGLSPHMRYFINGTNKRDETISFVTMDKTPSISHCTDGSMVNAAGCFILKTFALDVRQGHILIQRPKSEHYTKQTSNSILVKNILRMNNNFKDFGKETIIFTIDIITIQVQTCL